MPPSFLPFRNFPSRLRRFFEGITNLSYFSLLILWASLALLFAIAYFFLSAVTAQHGPVQLMDMGPWQRFFNAIYYSIITATSTGYGDITPQGISKALAAIQSILALMVFAIFVTKLVTNRQEVALQQVHKLTFEDVYVNVREGFFVIRQDFDQLITESKKHKKLSEQSWGNLVTAYKEGQSLLLDIPDFYDGQMRLYTLDIQRQELLQEAVLRTLKRINDMLGVFDRHTVAWKKHEKSLEELGKLTETVRTVTFYWQEKSPYEGEEAFEDILGVNKDIQDRLDAS